MGVDVAMRYVDALRSYAEDSNSFYQERKSVYWFLSRLKQDFRKPGFPFSFIPLSSKLFALKSEFVSLCDIEYVINIFLAFPTWLTWLVFYIFWLTKQVGVKDMSELVLTRMCRITFGTVSSEICTPSDLFENFSEAKTPTRDESIWWCMNEHGDMSYQLVDTMTNSECDFQLPDRFGFETSAWSTVVWEKVKKV